MRDKKISILLFVSFLLLLASFLILCTWVYNYYNKDSDIVKTPDKQVTITSEVSRDSLLRIYTSTIKELDSKIDSTYTDADSMETRLALRLDEYYRLKEELSALLKKPTSNDDFKTAKQKIDALQKKIQDMRLAGTDVELENTRLNKILSEMKEDNKNEPGIIQNIPSSISSRSAETNSAIPLFSTSELNLLTLKSDDEEEDADVFSLQKKIVGSFAVRNNSDLANNELMVVLTQPNGQVLQKSAWESGAFQSKDGKKIYSCKMNFTYSKGEVKKFSFSINPEKFIRGTYTMLLYHNGTIVGKLSKVLS